MSGQTSSPQLPRQSSTAAQKNLIPLPNQWRQPLEFGRLLNIA
jgi:hypothetical protein